MRRPHQFTIGAGMVAVALVGLASAMLIRSPAMFLGLILFAGGMLTPFLLVALGLGIGAVLFPMRPEPPTETTSSSSAGFHDL